MQKQIIILAAAIMPFAFFSCSKESIKTQQANNSATTDEAFATQKPGTIPIIKIKDGLTGMFEFNGNLKEKTGQLADAVPTIPGVTTYTTDRKGMVNKAIRFTGRYGLNILKVPTQPNSSVAAWVKYTSVPAPGVILPFLFSNRGPNFDQHGTHYAGVIITPVTTSVYSSPMDDNWHHLVATYDGNDLRFYVDGKYIGSSNNPSQYNPYTLTYNVGYMPFINSPLWQGCMDDLSFYSRTLSDADVQQLYNL